MQRYLSFFLLLSVVIISALTVQNISLQQEAFSLSSGVSVPTYTPPTTSPSTSSSNTVKNPTNNSGSSSNSFSSSSSSSSTTPSYNPSTSSNPSSNNTTPPPSTFYTPPAPSQPTTPTTNTEVIYLTKNLIFGMTDREVNLLQQVLKQEGLFSLTPTGYFGPLTLQAVMSFQRKYNIPTVGIVGPLTRAKINAGMYPVQNVSSDGKVGVNAPEQ